MGADDLARVGRKSLPNSLVPLSKRTRVMGWVVLALEPNPSVMHSTCLSAASARQSEREGTQRDRRGA